MKTYIFHGRVIPERAHVKLTGLNEMEIVQPESGLIFKLKLSILMSIISATVASEEEISDLLSLKNSLTDTISFFVDTIGFDKGCGYTIEMDFCVYEEGGKFIIFGVDIDKLKEEGRWETTLDLIQTYQQATNEQKLQLQRSLAEFRRGIRVSNDTGFHVYRAIESLQLTFAGNTETQKWNNLNTALNLNKTYSDNLRKNHANPQRHGAYTYMSSNDRTDMLIKAKTIISRFVSYIKNNNQNLSATDFPKLT